MNQETDFIGQGLSFPLRKIGGRLDVDNGWRKIESSIRMILSTAPGERLMRPEFGCAIWRQMFSPIDANTLGQIVHAVEEALERWEPRIDVRSVNAFPADDDPIERITGKNEGRINVEIQYTVKITNDRRNLVYPFYTLDPGGAS